MHVARAVRGSLKILLHYNLFFLESCLNVEVNIETAVSIPVVFAKCFPMTTFKILLKVVLINM